MSATQTLINQFTTHLLDNDRTIKDLELEAKELEFEIKKLEAEVETLTRLVAEAQSNLPMKMVLPNGIILPVEEIGDGYFKEIPNGLCIKIRHNGPPVVVGGYSPEGRFYAITVAQHQAMNLLGLTSDPLQRPPPKVAEPKTPKETFVELPMNGTDFQIVKLVCTTDKPVPEGYVRTVIHNLCVRLSDKKIVGGYDSRDFLDKLSPEQIEFCHRNALQFGSDLVPPVLPTTSVVDQPLDPEVIKSMTGNDPIKASDLKPETPRPRTSDIEPVIDWIVKNQRTLEVDTRNMKSGFCRTIFHDLCIRMSDMTVVGHFAGPRFLRHLTDVQDSYRRGLGLNLDSTSPMPY